jgi:hypothetical protein
MRIGPRGYGANRRMFRVSTERYKSEATGGAECASIRGDELSEFLKTLRSSLLMQVSAIEKMLGLRRRCRHCGNDI